MSLCLTLPEYPHALSPYNYYSHTPHWWPHTLLIYNTSKHDEEAEKHEEETVFGMED